MKNKEELLAELREGLNEGTISEEDLKTFVTSPKPQAAVTPAPQPASTAADNDKSDRLSVVDVMFYIAGLVLFAALMSIIVQSWSDGNPVVHILLSAGFGLLLWSVAYYLIRSPFQNDIRKGLINALLLTGSLSVIVGGYIITNEIIGGFNEVNFMAGALMFAFVGAAHIAYDRLIKYDLLLLMGIVLCVAAFPSLMFGLLKESSAQLDIWSVVFILSTLLLIYATRVVAKMLPDRHKIHDAFDSFAAFLALLTMYASSFGEYGVVWLVALIGSVFGIFYISIITQSKQLLGNASLFLVLTVITIAFKYFSGFGITTALIIATLGMLGSAAVAATINKKYFKDTAAASKPTAPASDQ